MLKLEYLRYHYNLSDGQVIDRSRTDLAFRYFLQVDVNDRLVNPSSLSRFRGRLGSEAFHEVFDQVVSFGRQYGLVKDRLRIKDASHVIADIAVPTTLGLVARTRDKLLAAAEPFEPVCVEGERINVELLREANASRSNEERLLARVTHLRDILAWVDELAPPDDASTNRRWQTLLQMRQMAHKILADQEDPQAGDRIRSTVDPEARRAKHGDWYDGYLTDLVIDADSEIITQVNVLPANGDEAADAIQLIEQEEATHGNDIESLSIDGIGFNGRVLRELEDPDGLAVNTVTPPPKERETTIFTPDDFVENEQRSAVTCPAGETSIYRQRDERHSGYLFRFLRTACEGCSELNRCMNHPPKGKFGKTVRKSDYEKKHRRAREKANTAEYAAIRQEHPKVERKLGEVMNRHGGRRARYRGRWKVMIQELMACTATNVKRIVQLVCAQTATTTCGI
jgi:IS5 family transposase